MLAAKRIFLIVSSLCAAAAVSYGEAAAPALVPLTVCEILRDFRSYQGCDVAVLGRYPYRENGRWVGEQSCDGAPPDTPPQLWMVENSKDAPRPPENFALDGAALQAKLRALERRTALAKFRFGSPDYDKWAVVFGRVEMTRNPNQRPATRLYRGSGAIVFLNRRPE